METMTELERRAVACKHWRWMPGMLAEGNYRVVTVTQSGYPNGCTADYDGSSCWELSADSLPDLTDPATVGCLLALVRQAWGDQRMFTTYDDGDTQWPWDVWIPNRRAIRSGQTETAALVAALEAAP